MMREERQVLYGGRRWSAFISLLSVFVCVSIADTVRQPPPPPPRKRSNSLGRRGLPPPDKPGDDEGWRSPRQREEWNTHV